MTHNWSRQNASPVGQVAVLDFSVACRGHGAPIISGAERSLNASQDQAPDTAAPRQVGASGFWCSAAPRARFPLCFCLGGCFIARPLGGPGR